MSKRIHEILLVSSPYDLYIMEEEGLLADRISDEYAILHLTHAPAITRVSTAEEAIELVRAQKFDLVITGLRVGKAGNVVDMAKNIKTISPNLPVVLITPETRQLGQITKKRFDGLIDKVFYWHGDTRIFLAIIKLFEDSINAEHDCIGKQVRAIILVEDSPHFYSAYLPLMYTEIVEHTRSLIAEGTSDEEKLLRMESRPKIIMAETYEDAALLYNKYRSNILGIISDIRFPKDGALNPEAGFLFTELVKKDNPDIPVMLQSQDASNSEKARTLEASFADKNSAHLLHDLRNFILTYFGFGDFIFRTPEGKEVGRARTLREMEKTLLYVPDEVIEYHSKRHHFSNWLFARGEFELAARLKPMRFSDFSSTDELRETIREGLKEANLAKRKSKITKFSAIDYDPTMPFVRFGEGSIGGKGRGIAFMSRILADPLVSNRFRKQNIYIPETAAIGTDVFDKFLDRNRLHSIALESTDDAHIAKNFLKGVFSPKLTDELASFLKLIDEPIVVRSSSLSEDSLSQPFAGLYTTYFIPNNNKKFEERLETFLNAIKLVYASTFFANPKAFMEANGIALESEKMAVLIQKVVGRQHDNLYYPDLAGVAQSYNFFPVGYLKPEDGVAEIVMGLGTMAVRGGNAVRFSPKYPGIMPQFSGARDIALRSQREFNALDLSTKKPIFLDDAATLATLPIAISEEHGVLGSVGGVYSQEDEMIYDGLHREGQRVLTFKKALGESAFPLPKIIAEILELGASGLGCSVEIEFAANLARGNTPASFAFLQIRPLVSSEDMEEVSVNGIERKKCLAQTSRAMGNGIFNGIKNIIYVKPDSFDTDKTSEIASEVGRFNLEMVRRGEKYILLGFGRWGTVNPRLGIPVTYAQVSHAKVICEIATQDMNVEPSQGTHFFHNIASLQIGYLSIDTNSEDNFVDWKWLEEMSASMETKFLKLISLENAVITRIDGRVGHGVILKP